MTKKSYPFCLVCKAWNKPLHKNAMAVSKNTTSLRYMCRECRNIKQKNYYARNRERCAKIVYKSIAKYPEKQKARAKLNDNILRGKIIKPSNCERCGTYSHRIQGHHHDYTKPLDVEWLCSGCHASEK